MKKSVLDESIYEVPSSVMKKLVDFVAESEEIFFLALLKIISHFCFIKASSKIKWEKLFNKFPQEEDWDKDSFLTELSWFVTIFPEKSSSFHNSVNKAFEKLENEGRLDSKRLSEIKIAIRGVVNFPNHLEDLKTSLDSLRLEFEKGKKSIPQVLRELAILLILHYKEESFPYDILAALNLLWLRISNPLYCFFQDLIQKAQNDQNDQEDRKTSLSVLLILLYELKIIFSSEIIFFPEFCAD